ncbi:glycosyl transferase family 2 [Stenotrophomonas maltophilia]|uniref:glycosyltransferase family 2 protein n=1 Tax=Stenotrophomonas chelatiphaga TaxID=517011 RepID=UPI000F4CF231|nr:glycosyltransferase family A protein [Stenotrophomonas chelatiphaga]MCS4230397.1 glycosyltransferase involved in cell wall biosynthesis [Stenotrophomonas chelatiphaga]ROQ40327.1 glycosyl transferase family 2 [Stenotrophomonas maltophilia]
MSPYFSVVVPTYNRSNTIEATLRSVISQTYPSFECIIVDDGSNDVVQLEQLVASLSDPRLKIISQKNGGGGAARNTGIVNATGKYVAFLDSDDLFHPNKLDLFHKLLEKEPHEAAYSYARVDRGVPGRSWIRPDRPIRSDESMARYLFIANQFVQTSTIVMETRVARRIMFDPSLRKGQDLDFCLRADVAGVRFHMLEKPLITWTDASEIGRTSRHAGASAPQAWLAAHQHLMTKEETLGYRATVLAYYQPKYRLLQVVRDLILGVLIAKVPVKVAARQLLRFILPRHLYRSAVALAIKLRGARADNRAENAN